MQKTQNNIGLVWFRNDLRVHDNTSISNALQNHDIVLACYCFDPRYYETSQFGFKKTEKFRAKFLLETVADLKQNLKTLNIELFVYHEYPENVLKAMVDTYSISDIYCQSEWTSEEVNVFTKVKSQLPEHINYHETYDQFLFHPEDVVSDIQNIPKVFTVFRKKLEKQSLVRACTSIESAISNKPFKNDTALPTLQALGFEPFETHPNSAFPFKGGESSALKRLEYYCFETKKLGVYKKTRNGLVGTDYSSKFSSWLANGSISARTIYWQVKAFEKKHFINQSTYWLIFELIWRDFFKYISMKHGNAIFSIGGILKKNYEWKSDQDLIQKWIDGDTKSAFVNANMIELKKTGWMSNRGRQNVASFFAKDMLLDWRIGAAYFEAMLIDYDVHSNYGNWMYVAGVGNDPRDRKFNVDLQAQRYDVHGKFQKLWLQETLF